LLGEHRELHGVHAIIAHGKRGYARHPETLRWAGALSGLACRHAHLVAEMRLRGYVDRSPLPRRQPRARWPATFVTEPADQLALLRAKYAGTTGGRIPLPRSAQELWAHHKYSVMARDPETCRRLGRAVARARSPALMHDLARTLVLTLREAPSTGRLVNALEHMWGHVSDAATDEDVHARRRGPAALLATIQSLALRHREPFLLASTALGELAAHVGPHPA
jgi:uncharacterized protein YbgA (DUF1722 family)